MSDNKFKKLVVIGDRVTDYAIPMPVDEAGGRDIKRINPIFVGLRIRIQ
jgi:hypothetical protein